MKCKYCESEKLVIETRGVHKAIVCTECGKWNKNATKEEVFKLTRIEGLTPSAIVVDDYAAEEEVRMSFGRAFNFINNPVTKDKMGMRLPHWKEDVVVRIQFPDENSKMTAPYLYVESRFGRVAWIPTQIELFSKDWVVVY